MPRRARSTTILSSRGRGGFAAVLANPPFGNAIEQRTGRSETMAAWCHRTCGVFAHGATDRALLFWATAFRLLRNTHARYALIAPASVLAESTPWSQWMQRNAGPDHLWLLPAFVFAHVRVRTVIAVGGACTTGSLTLHDGRGPPVAVSPGELLSRGWLQAFQPAMPAAGTTALLPLRALATVQAGCSTGAAYELARQCIDDAHGITPRLINTGLIDRFVLHWGSQAIRFLGVRTMHPRWPSMASATPQVQRALARQQGPKVLIAGLSSVIEAVWDARGDTAGVVSTFALQPLHEHPSGLLLTAVLNAATFSHRYVSQHGGRAMSGRQLTILRPSLAEALVPAVLQTPPAQTATSGHDVPSLLALLERVAAALHQAPSAVTQAALERLLHLGVARLYGLDNDAAERDYRWFCARTNGVPIDDDPVALCAREDVARALQCESSTG